MNQTGSVLQVRKRVLSKTVGERDNRFAAKLELPGFQKGRSPFVLRAPRVKKQFLPGGSTRRFFAQLRSVGSKPSDK